MIFVLLLFYFVFSLPYHLRGNLLALSIFFLVTPPFCLLLCSLLLYTKCVNFRELFQSNTLAFSLVPLAKPSEEEENQPRVTASSSSCQVSDLSGRKEGRGTPAYHQADPLQTPSYLQCNRTSARVHFLSSRKANDCVNSVCTRTSTSEERKGQPCFPIRTCCIYGFAPSAEDVFEVIGWVGWVAMFWFLVLLESGGLIVASAEKVSLIILARRGTAESCQVGCWKWNFVTCEVLLLKCLFL